MDGGTNLKYGERDVNFDRIYPFNGKNDAGRKDFYPRKSTNGGPFWG